MKRWEQSRIILISVFSKEILGTLSLSLHFSTADFIESLIFEKFSYKPIDSFFFINQAIFLCV